MKLRKLGKSAVIAGAVVLPFGLGILLGGGALAASASPAPVNADGVLAAAATAGIPATKGAVSNYYLGKGAVFGDNMGPGMVSWFTTVWNGSVHAAGLDADLTNKLASTRTLAGTADPTEVGLIGGPIKANGTKLSMDLTVPAGKYLTTVSGQIDRHQDAAKPGRATQPQLSLWIDSNNNGEFEWQDGEGSISPNCTIPDTTGRSCTVSGSTVLTFTEAKHLKFVAFGYNGDGSDAGSNELAVSNATLILVPMR